VVIKLVQSRSGLTKKASRKAAGKKRLTCRGYVIYKYVIVGISSDLIRVPYAESSKKMRYLEQDCHPKLIPVGQHINHARPPQGGPFNCQRRGQTCAQAISTRK